MPVDIAISEQVAAGLKCHWLGDPKAAVKCYLDYLTEINPTMAEVLNLLGVAYLSQGEYQPALMNLQGAVSLKPDVAMFHCNLGQAYEQGSRVDKSRVFPAIAAFQKALEIDPNLAAPRYFLKGEQPVKDASVFNTPEQINNAIYRRPQGVQEYLNERRRGFYIDCIALLYDKGIGIEDKSIADVGCGLGYLLKLAAEYKPTHLTGLDNAEASFEVAHLYCPTAEYVLHDLHEPYPGQFDIVFCIQVLEHVLYEGDVLLNLMEMVKLGGCVLITVPNGRYDSFFEHVNFWSPESWRGFIRAMFPRATPGLLECGLMPNGNNYALLRKR